MLTFYGARNGRWDGIVDITDIKDNLFQEETKGENISYQDFSQFIIPGV